jgi:hypothetical protein
MRNHSPLPNLNEVNAAAIDSNRLRPGSYRNNAVLPPRPMPVRPFAMSPPVSPKVLAATQGPKVPPRRIADEHNVSAMTSISTVRTALGHMSLPTKRHTAVPAGPALNPDLRAV